MRVVFMGTPDFAVPSLQLLIDRGEDICAVFTQPDKPKGRGHKLQAPPVKELALQHDIPVYQPTTLRDAEAQKILVDLAPEIIIVAAYGKLLPKSVLDLPKYGCINVHGSLLPKYRGAAPIQWAVLNGEKTAGVTTMYMAEGMDTGDMLLKAGTPVGEDETAGELFDRLMVLGAELLGKTLDAMLNGTLTRTPQDESEATHAPMLSKEMSKLDFSRPAEELHHWICGLNPWPCATAVLHGKRIKVLSSRVVHRQGEPGKLAKTEDGLLVYCGTDALLITGLQTENGKRMDGAQYLLGHPLQPEDRMS